MTIRFGSKVPGTAMEIRDVNMDFAYGGSFTESSAEAYERLILDVLLGDPPLFPQHAEVELSWKILDPILDHWAEGRQGKRPSSTSPAPGDRPSADAMLARDGRSLEATVMTMIELIDTNASGIAGEFDGGAHASRAARRWGW